MKKELTELLEKGYQAEREFIASLTDKERNSNGTFELWTAKDILAHDSYWRKHHGENMLVVLAGESPIQTDDDQINEGFMLNTKINPGTRSKHWPRPALSAWELR